MSKINVDLKAFDNLAMQLERMGADVEKAQNEALVKARDYTNNKLKELVSRKNHINTGALLGSITNSSPIIKDGIAEVGAGFNFEKHGWVSRFFLAKEMKGSPNKQKDQEMWDLLYSDAEKKKREEIIKNYLKGVINNFGR